MNEISINDVSPVKIGQVENAKAGTGCTVILCENGMRAGFQDLVGSLAAEVVSEAIKRAVKSALSAYGYVAASDVSKSI